MNKSKLNFAQLENEYEMLSPSKASSIKGGLEYVGELGTVTIYGTNQTYDWSGFLGQFTMNSQGQAIFGDNVGGATGSGSVNLSQTFQNLGYLADESTILALSADNLGAAKAFGKLSLAASTAGFAFDSAALINHYNNNIGDMDGIRFTIRTGTTGTAILAGAAAASGGTAVVVGLLVTAAGAGAEYAYDVTLETLNRLWGNFVNNYGNGGLPTP
ncbi:hypothetical protein [Pedobacter sp. AJM]|uniref:hypothetical protein n=1 Tax=Pedobacter sp. AJM TaxID=2003629 RepID=UPI000B4B634B|nr:hypothetical protein [Pedobacter sp. AJM]OWK68652.1 hypothetical protein CBW18_21075 [Pedobacter sp. AJM]